MIKNFSILLLTILTLAASADEIWLFGVKGQTFYNQHKFKNSYEIKHYLIDGGRAFEAEISQGLSSDLKIATRQVAQRFKKNKILWEKQAKKSWQGAVNAQSIGIKKIPAITFDKGKSVIYGVLDLSKAHKIWSSKQ